MEEAAARFEENMEDEPLDYYDLTGIDTLTEFEKENKYETKCSHLWNESNRRHYGIFGIITSQILSLEALCQKIDPLDNNETRDTWRDSLLEITNQWHSGSSFVIGAPPVSDKNKGNAGEAIKVTPSKRQRKSMGLEEKDYNSVPKFPAVSITQLLSQLKVGCFLLFIREAKLFTSSSSFNFPFSHPRILSFLLSLESLR